MVQDNRHDQAEGRLLLLAEVGLALLAEVVAQQAGEAGVLVQVAVRPRCTGSWRQRRR